MGFFVSFLWPQVAVQVTQLSLSTLTSSVPPLSKVHKPFCFFLYHLFTMCLFIILMPAPPTLCGLGLGPLQCLSPPWPAALGAPGEAPRYLLTSGAAPGPHPFLQILTLASPHRSIFFIVKLHNNHWLSSSPSSGLLDIARFWSSFHKPASYQSRFTLETWTFWKRAKMLLLHYHTSGYNVVCVPSIFCNFAYVLLQNPFDPILLSGPDTMSPMRSKTTGGEGISIVCWC